MIYIVGVDHDIQHNGKVNRLPLHRATEIRDEFQKYLAQVAAEKGVELIAEESCEEILVALKAQATMPSLAATGLGIRHVYIEPCGLVRNQLGVPNHPYSHFSEDQKLEIYKIRESYWLQRIQQESNSTVLVVCGASHVKSFSKLLSESSYEVSLLVEQWGKQYMPSS